MIGFIFRRFFSAIPLLFAVTFLTLSLLHFIPGDPTDFLLGENATAPERLSLRAELGLNKNLSEHLLDTGKGLLHFDLGHSLYSKTPISQLIAERLPVTFCLGLFALLLAIVLGIPCGLLSAIHAHSIFDKILWVLSLFFSSMPGVILGPTLVFIFAIEFWLLPVSGNDEFTSIILPGLSLALPLSSVLLRITRAATLEVLKEDYIRVARAKGLSEWNIYFRHALKNACPPILTVLGLQAGAVMTGTVITESIFDWPGLGLLLYDSIQRRDYPLIQACVLCISIIYLLVFVTTDILTAKLNPKIRIEERG